MGSMDIEQSNTINLSKLVGYSLHLGFSCWNSGIGWEHISEGCTDIPDYYESPGLPIAFLIEQPFLSDWVESIPKNVLLATLKFEREFVGHSFTSLYFASRSKEAKELLLDAPELVWLVLEHATQKQLDRAEVIELFKLKRTKILELHGIEPRKAILKFLKTLPKEKLDEEYLETLKHLLEIHDITKLNRISYATPHIVNWLIQEPRWVDAKFIRNSTQIYEVYALKRYVRDTLTMGEQLGLQNIYERLCDCKCEAEIIRTHDQLVNRVNEVTNARLLNTPFPPPPFKNDLGVSAITDYKSLVEEGQSMHHCIVSYQFRICNGKYYVYRIYEPQRATIGLVFSGGKWKIDQIRLACNAEPSDETKEQVYLWFSNVTPKPNIVG